MNPEQVRDFDEKTATEKIQISGHLKTSWPSSLETAAFNEAEMAEYCRKKGLFAEQIQQ